MDNYGGIYRGIVTRNVDPEGRHRIMVRVPQVLGDQEVEWAEPCVPVNWFGTGTNGAIFVKTPAHSNHSFTDTNNGTGASGNVAVTLTHDHNHDKFVLQDAVPKVGATVWIMFEGGNPDYPVWMGVIK